MILVFYVCNNDDNKQKVEGCYDKLHKVRMLLNLVNYKPETEYCLAMDEMIIPFSQAQPQGLPEQKT